MKKSEELEKDLLEAVSGIPAVDIHTHICCESPFAKDVGELIGDYHFKELAFSAGMGRDVLSAERLDEATIEEMVSTMSDFDNTLQYSWLMDIARGLFDFQATELSPDNLEQLALAVKDRSEEVGRGRKILEKAAIEKVFVPMSFWEKASGADSDVFVPILNANELVFGLDKPETRKRLRKTVKMGLPDSTALRDSIDEVLKKFLDQGCAGVCIGLPSHFKVFPVVERDFDAALEKNEGHKALGAAETANLQCGTLFTLAELCNVYALPVMLMSGSVRDASLHGIVPGKDLPVADDTLRSLLPLFNHFPKLNWCVSVLSGSQAQELSTYGGTLQNVFVSGHWRYHSIPEYIERDLMARIQSIPKTKFIGYYSGMYKFEFGYAKYRMYRRILAGVLARDLVLSGRGSEEDAVDVARYLLRNNAYRIFGLESF